jgi:ribosomal protein L24
VKPLIIGDQPHSALKSSDPGPLVQSVDFRLIGPDLGKDVKASLDAALTDGAVFAIGNNPVSIFRQILGESIRSIESHPRGILFQEFLLKGPYEDVGKIPTELIKKRISDSECAAAITFIYSHMVNCFKGGVTELLAAKACMRHVNQLKKYHRLPAQARLFIGDAVGVALATGRGHLKGADMHVLTIEPKANGVTVAGVVEVKSYLQSKNKLRGQLEKHIQRAIRGLRVENRVYSAERIKISKRKDQGPIRIMVLPSAWELPRKFWFDESDAGKYLRTAPGRPMENDDQIVQTGDDEWLIRLRWSV